MTEQPLIIHQAKWVVPIDRPVLADGAVVVAGDRIVAVGPAAEILPTHQPGAAIHYDHGEGAIIPALVNAHVHLEFSALRQAIAPQKSLPAWLQAAIDGFSALSPGEIDHGVRDGIAEMQRFGTILAAEVSNTGRSLPLLADSDLESHYFYECLGFNLLGNGRLAADFPFLAQAALESIPVSAAAHAPYSVSAPLFHRIKAWNRTQGRLTSVHLAESLEELQFLQQGNGFFQQLLQQRGRWYEGYTSPGCSPAAYLDRLDFLDEQTLAVHGVWLDAPDRDLLAQRGVWLALCPRSNLHTGAGFPDLIALQQAGLKLALGTDSLASTPDLNLFQEIRVLQERFPEVQLSDLLAMATINGAAALNRAEDFGSLSPGKKAALLFLPIPAGMSLWPELLHSGVQGQIFWLTPKGKEFSNGA
jgi:aminodeoxyfutalosine deaminase